MEVIRAVKGLRNLCGHSKSVLVVASDGFIYVLKCRANPKASRACFNEYFASRLASRLQLPTPAAAVISVDREFLDSHRDLWSASAGTTSWLPVIGLHFGSRLVQGRSFISEASPEAWFPRILNRSDFLSMLIFDVWGCHSGHRQAVFAEAGNNNLKAVFIDNDCMFGGPAELTEVERQPSTFWNRSVYSGIEFTPAVLEVAETILSWDFEALWITALGVPDEWRYADMRSTIRALSKRRKYVERLVASYRSFNSLSPSEVLKWHDQTY